MQLSTEKERDVNNKVGVEFQPRIGHEPCFMSARIFMTLWGMEQGTVTILYWLPTKL